MRMCLPRRKHCTMFSIAEIPWNKIQYTQFLCLFVSDKNAHKRKKIRMAFTKQMNVYNLKFFKGVKPRGFPPSQHPSVPQITGFPASFSLLPNPCC